MDRLNRLIKGGKQRTSKVYLIAGLGNPGLGYRHTRHNIGYNVVGLWARRLGVPLSNRRFGSRNGQTRVQNVDVILLRPQTYMNQSGMSIKACVDFFNIDTEDLLIVHDDLDLSVGRIKVVRNGGGGGHKGVISVIEHMGTRRFNRLKVGIGRPRYGEPIEEYVLSPFYSEERKIIEEVIQRSVGVCELFLSEGVDSAMNQINCKNLADKEVTY